VLTRWYDIDDDVTQSSVKRQLWDLAETILPPGRAAAWNEGLMELGQRICTPTAPDCEACPVAAHCAAYASGVQEQRPVKAPPAPIPHYDVTAGVIRRADGRFLIAKRPLDKMLGGLWEFPGGKREEGEALIDCLRREIREELAIDIEVGRQITTIRHAYTHFKITLYVFDCRHLRGEPQAVDVADWMWITLDQVEDYAFSSTDQQIIQALAAGGQMAMDLGAL
jgi:A/G-specific adenine glycosylase